MKSRSEIESIVDDVLVKLLHIDAAETHDASREKTAKWSSLMHIEIFFALEEQFDVRFDDDAIAFAEDRDDLVSMIQAAIAE